MRSQIVGSSLRSNDDREILKPSPLVTVVIPVRNRENLIERAMISVGEQTIGDWECLVVDDHSTDRTSSVVADLVACDDRFRLIQHESPAGAQAARNTGIRMARGDWVAFLDSDDRWLPSSLTSRLGIAAMTDVAVVHSDAYISVPSGERARLGVPPLRGSCYEELLRRPGPVFPALLVKRLVLEDIGPLDEALVSYQEWDTYIRIAQRTAFGFVDEPTFEYSLGNADQISADKRKVATGYEQVVTKHRTEILERLGPAQLALHYKVASKLHWQARDPLGFFRCLSRFTAYGLRARRVRAQGAS